jgi:hypothetical protein
MSYYGNVNSKDKLKRILFNWHIIINMIF